MEAKPKRVRITSSWKIRKNYVYFSGPQYLLVRIYFVKVWKTVIVYCKNSEKQRFSQSYARINVF